MSRRSWRHALGTMKTMVEELQVQYQPDEFDHLTDEELALYEAMLVHYFDGTGKAEAAYSKLIQITEHPVWWAERFSGVRRMSPEKARAWLESHITVPEPKI